jgi:hypothetical protein
MLASSALPVFGASAVAVTVTAAVAAAAHQPVDERIISNYLIPEPLQQIVATDFSTVSIPLPGQDTKWRLQLDQVDNWVSPDLTGEPPSQLAVLSFLQEDGDTLGDKVDFGLCVTIFEGQAMEANAVQSRWGDEACGLYDACISDIKLQAKSSSSCSFDLPPSCKASSNREWLSFDSGRSPPLKPQVDGSLLPSASASVHDYVDVQPSNNLTVGASADTTRILAITTKRTRGESQEPRPFLVVTHGYFDGNSPWDSSLVETHCLVPKPVTNESNARTELKRRGPAPEQDHGVVRQAKTSEEDGKAAADTAQVSLIVAVAAVLTAMLLSF